MIKAIKVGKKNVGVDNSCGFLVIYINQFDSDPLRDIIEFKKDITLSKSESKITLLKLFWAMAKNYDKSVTFPEKWLKGFEIDYFKLAIQIFEVLTQMLRLEEEEKKGVQEVQEEEGKLTTPHLIASALCYGFSLKDFCEMELRNYIKVCKSYAIIKGFEEEEREATQADFDRF